MSGGKRLVQGETNESQWRGEMVRPFPSPQDGSFKESVLVRLSINGRRARFWLKWLDGGS